MENTKQTKSEESEKIVNLCEDMNSHSHNDEDYKIAMKHQEKMKQKLNK